jgi:FkbM family methyltransferase
MLSKLMAFVRNRWHPLWRLRQSPTYRAIQKAVDLTVYTKIPDTKINVAVRLLRDASWIVAPRQLEMEVRAAFIMVLDQLKPRVFWDVGANIGFYSWWLRQHASIQQVVMFEPDPENFELITKTLRKNRIRDCEAMNVALADRDGEAVFLLDRISGSAGSLEAVPQERRGSMQRAYQLDETTTCRTTSVDGLIANGTPAPDVMKIDVEGAEGLVIAGAKSWLATDHPVLIVETSNLDLVKDIAAMGYRASRIDAENVLFVPLKAKINLRLPVLA